MPQIIYTLGYTGIKPALIKLAVEAANLILADIRFSPRSRVPQWTKKQLTLLLGERYTHIGALGNANYKNGDPIQLVDADAGVILVSQLLGRSAGVVLLCGCAEVAHCHRLPAGTLISERLRLPLIHLDQAALLRLAGGQSAAPAAPTVAQLALFDTPEES